ncbi:MAG: AAA family ATPase [Gemmatimonadaceae bacterium]
MPIVPLYGHQSLRDRLAVSRASGTLPQSLLFHGPVGVGKQRLALWLAQSLVCERREPPCDECRHCRYVRELSHPDVTWAFPVPRPKDGDRDVDEIRASLQVAARERAETHGLYAAPSGSDGIFIATVRALVQQAAMSPALATRKIFIIGDADRMVPQEGSEFAANAFLKLLEEPPRDTYLVLTTSAVGSLLPTIRSRVVAMRVPPLPERDIVAFMDDPTVAAHLGKLSLPASRADRVALAAGAPGRLLSSAETAAATAAAQAFLDAAISGQRATVLRMAFVQGASGARGAFSDVLDALTHQLHARARHATMQGEPHAAVAAGRAAELVEDAKLLAAGNVNPQLVSARLLRDMAALFA